MYVESNVNNNLCHYLTKKKVFAGVITEEMYESQQNADIISTLTREFDEVRKEEEEENNPTLFHLFF